MKQYDLFSLNGNRKLNEFPIEAETEEQLKALIRTGLMYDLGAVYYKPAQTIKSSDITFKKTHSQFFQAKSEGVNLYTGYVEKGKVQIIDKEGVWNNDKIPLSVFKLLPNWNLEF